jgi:phosphosulfolactate synthase
MAATKAWDTVFPNQFTNRIRKPRTVGVTMLIDKNLGTSGLTDLLETAGDAIDQIKFAFGTSVALDERTIRIKIELIHAHRIDMYPGGTLLEAAIVHNVLPEFLRRASSLGFTMIEVSDGTIRMQPEQRADVIKRALDMGFKVISEVGKKDPRHQPSVELMQALIGADLSLGVNYVIIEAREAGQGVGIYDAVGAVDQVELNELVSGIDDLEKIVWEAPLSSQQAYLINRFGPNVNLGNIQPTDALALEALRCGLRFETLRKVATEHEHETMPATHDPWARLLSVAQNSRGD